MERLINDKDIMARIILQPSRIGMTVPMVASKINLLSDFFIRIIKEQGSVPVLHHGPGKPSFKILE